MSQIDKRILELGEDSAIEVESKDRHGNRLVYWEIKTPIFDKNDKSKIVGLCGISTNITERKKAEDTIKESEAQFRGLFIQSHIATAIVGLDKCIIRCNDAFLHFLGCSEEEIIGKTIADFTHPEDKEIGMNEMRQVIKG